MILALEPLEALLERGNAIQAFPQQLDAFGEGSPRHAHGLSKVNQRDDQGQRLDNINQRIGSQSEHRISEHLRDYCPSGNKTQAASICFKERGGKKEAMPHRVHNPPNDTPLDELFVFCSVDEKGLRGIIASVLPGLGSTPFVTGSKGAMEAMKPLAREIAKETGKRVELYQFNRGPVIWTSAE